MATLNVHKTAKTAAISFLAADVPAAQGGATTSRCIPPQGGQPGAPGQLGECPRLTPPAPPKRSLSFHILHILGSQALSRQEASAAERTPRCLLHKLGAQLSQAHQPRQQQQLQVPPAPQGRF